MRNALRSISILVSGVLIFALGALGWIGLLDYLALLFPNLHEIAAAKFIRSIAILVGLALVLLPFYTLLYFHSTAETEILGFKTPKSNQKPEPSHPANPRNAGD